MIARFWPYASTPGRLRALTNRPVRKLAAISPDPVAAWRRADPHVIRGLVGVELRSAGLARYQQQPVRLPV